MEHYHKQHIYAINLKCNFNCMKLPSIYTDLCLKQVYVIATASQNSRCRLVVNSVSCQLQAAASADCSCSSWFKVM